MKKLSLNNTFTKRLLKRILVTPDPFVKIKTKMKRHKLTKLTHNSFIDHCRLLYFFMLFSAILCWFTAIMGALYILPTILLSSSLSGSWDFPHGASLHRMPPPPISTHDVRAWLLPLYTHRKLAWRTHQLGGRWHPQRTQAVCTQYISLQEIHA